MKPYDPKTDYCGPGKGVLAKMISNKPWGTRINFCCYAHDRAYEIGGTGGDRYLADLQLWDCIYGKLAQKWWIPKFVAEMVSRRYYIAVRVFGSSRFNYTQPFSRPQEEQNPPLEDMSASS